MFTASALSSTGNSMLELDGSWLQRHDQSRATLREKTVGMWNRRHAPITNNRLLITE
jgi:hypothetical protein